MAEKRRTFKDLVAWQKAIDLIPPVYALIDSLPVAEQFALCDQMRRSVVSVSANIAEGQGQDHRRVFLRHLSIARGSLSELQSLLNAAHRLGYLAQVQLEDLEERIQEIRRLIGGLRRSIEAMSVSKLE